MLISVIIPCFNVENYISECIESVVNQTYQQIEIICIDNNSKDGTWQKLLDLQNKYTNLYIDKELKAGANSARNKGLKKAQGEWIQFLDADDLLLPNKIEHQVQLISTNDKLDFIVAAFTQKKLNGSQILVPVKSDNYFVEPFINNCGITSSNLWNKKALFDVGIWNEEIQSSQETELMLRLVLDGKKYMADNTSMVIIRERESGQISQSNPDKKWRQFINIRIDFLNKLKVVSNDDYNLNRGIFYDYLMVSVLTLAKYNKKWALDIYVNFIKENWKPAGNYGFTKGKGFLINVIGLKNYIRLQN